MSKSGFYPDTEQYRQNRNAISIPFQTTEVKTTLLSTSLSHSLIYKHV